MERNYQIAGLHVSMNTFGRTACLALPYQVDSDAAPDMVINTGLRLADPESPAFEEDALEYMTTGRLFYRQLIAHGGMMLHASAVAMDGKAYLFTADSGTGKSTHTALWRQAFGDERVRLINDDKPAVRMVNGVFYAYGTPWCGKTGQNLNLCYPLAGICFIERAAQNAIERYVDNDIVFKLMKQISWDQKQVDPLLSLLDRLLTQVPVWRLHCNMEREAAILSHRVMSGDDA